MDSKTEGQWDNGTEGQGQQDDETGDSRMGTA